MKVPAYIVQDITVATLAAIEQGGCESGAYMPAVTYSTALAVMNEHGDDIFEDFDDWWGEVPEAPRDLSWSGLATHYLSIAVDIWAGATLNRLRDADPDLDEWNDERAVADINL